MDTLEIDLKNSAITVTEDQPRSVEARAAVEKGTRGSSKVVFEQITPDDYWLSYACLIIPKFPSHRLLGDLSVALPEYLQGVCFSFTWRLELVNVNPEYLQWILQVSPDTSSAYFMKQTRREMSKKIFQDFPALSEVNLSKDFWAPPYFVIVSTQPHPAHLVNEFIRATRRQQGF